MFRYHIDTDMGVDDGLALVIGSRMLGSALTAVSTVFGNVPVHLATRNALIFRQLLQPDCRFRIIAGADRASDGYFRDARHIHGEDGLGGATAGLSSSVLYQVQSETDVASLSEVVPNSTADQKVVIIGLGPTTNMIRLVELYGQSNVERIVLMGGVFLDQGNITSYAEFNAHSDPFALRNLLDIGVQITIVPLDICRKIQLSRSTVRSYLDIGQSSLARLIVDSHMKYMDFYNEWEGVDGCFPHDAIAVLVAIVPEWFYQIRARISVDISSERRGKTSMSFDQSSQVSVVFGGALKNVRDLLRTLRI
jgi:purine nucleosidase